MDFQSFTEKLPPDFWYKTVVFLGIVLGIILAVRFYQKSNKLFLTMGILVVMFVLTFHWTYNRTEPAWATPVIEQLAKVFPTKDYYRKESGGL